MPFFKPFVPVPVTLLALAAASPAQTLTRWSGNGHDYAVIPLASGQGWESAKLDAQARGGYLATLTSAAENAFVTALADDPADWVSQYGAWNFGPYIGFFHADAPGPHPTGWRWVTGEPEGYTHWDSYSNEPNNFGGHEDYATLHSPGDTRQGYWNDLDPTYPIQPDCYVLERDGAPVPEPAPLAALGLAAFGVRARKRAAR